MAVTKIWPVKDSLSRLIEYAENPEKTAFESLETVMAYAGDEDKVIYEKGEKCYLVTALNCRGNALESMIKVQKHFGARGENIAYHAYQSFKPGEVTPEQCHEIGVKLAEKLWGNRYQVLVATHTNCSHLHKLFYKGLSVYGTKPTTKSRLSRLLKELSGKRKAERKNLWNNT